MAVVYFRILHWLEHLLDCKEALKIKKEKINCFNIEINKFQGVRRSSIVFKGVQIVPSISCSYAPASVI